MFPAFLRAQKRPIPRQGGRVALEREAGTAVDHSSLRAELLAVLGVYLAA